MMRHGFRAAALLLGLAGLLGPGPCLRAQAPSSVPGPRGAPAPRDPDVLFEMFTRDLPDKSLPQVKKTAEDIAAEVRRTPKRRHRAVLRHRVRELTKLMTNPKETRRVDSGTHNRIDDALAEIANQVGAYPDAVELSNDALDRDPNDRAALDNLPTAQLGLGEYAAAIAAATRASAAHPDDETAYTVRALAHYASGNYVEAIDDSQRALALNQNNETALYTLKLAQNRLPTPTVNLTEQQKEQADGVRREYESMLWQSNEVGVMSRELRDALSAQAAAKIQQGKSWAAVEDINRLLAADPHSAAAYAMRAAAYNLLGKYQSASEDAATAIALDPKNAAAYDAHAVALNQLGRYREAIDDSTRSLALNPRNAYAYANRARADEEMRDFTAMLADYQAAASLDPQFEPVYREALSRMKRPAATRPVPKPGFLPSSERASGALRLSSLWITFIATLLGGVLIAIGFLHILSTTWSRRLADSGIGVETIPTGRVLSNYQLRGALGQGGMGIVYEAVDKTLGRTVAIKKMRDEVKLDPKEREHFLREARTVAALRHPSIVEIHTILEEGTDLYLVFEHVPGRTLTQILSEKKHLSLKETEEVLRGVCAALEYAHQHQVIHRDLKPSNIMVTEEGAAKVMDFGIARQAKDALDRACVTNTVVGTPQYMAPEAEQGVVREESDVYGLGVCLYEMLAGQRPFSGSSISIAKMTLQYPKLTQLRPDLPPEIDALIADALRPDPEQRIHSAADFLARFEALARPTAA